MSSNDLQQKLRAGVEAARNGDRPTARRLLEQVLAADDRNEMAWLWLASVVNTLPERRACLEKVLQINPKNQRAQEALRKLGETRTDTREDQRTRQTIDRLRGGAAPTAARGARGGGITPPTEVNISSSMLIFGGLILSVLVIVAVLISAANAPSPADLTPTAVVFVASATPTITETPTDTPTNTPVTPVNLANLTRNAPTLPPTFTPSPTFTPTNTFTASPEPPGLETFDVIYSSLNSGADQPDLYLMRGDGTGESLFVDAGREAVFSPDGSQVAFVRDVNGFPEIFVAPTNNPGATEQITQLGIADTGHPSWSPDGSRLIFSSSNQSSAPELWVIELGPKRLSRLTQNTTIEREPAWSPVGNTILFASDVDTPGSVEIYSVALSDSGDAIVGTPTRLTDAAKSSYSPAWSFDGQTIAFISDRTGDGDVYVMDTAGQGEFQLTQQDDDFDAEDRRPAFSPDGRWIFFLSNRNTDNFQIFAMLADGTASFQVLDNGRNDQSVVFRP